MNNYSVKAPKSYKKKITNLRKKFCEFPPWFLKWLQILESVARN